MTARDAAGNRVLYVERNSHRTIYRCWRQLWPLLTVIHHTNPRSNA